ncbi:MAG: hypothetical protein AMXMBFR6_05590 [Betaproteobacteria bacterium]|nr:sigma-E factor negative regulatory protein [Rhodocyclaceae bacterium]
MDGSDVSALVDGEIDGMAADRVLDRLRADADARAHWEMFHLIGDALRGELSHDLGRADQIMSRVETEPTVLAPMRRKPWPQKYWLAVAASVMAVSALGWLALTMRDARIDGPLQTEGSTLASKVGNQTDLVSSLSGPVGSVRDPIRDPIQPYLVAHQAFSPIGKLQGSLPLMALEGAAASSQREDDR